MARPYTAEDREDKIIQIIDARIKAIKHDIRDNHTPTVERIADRMEGDYPTRGVALAVLRVACRYGLWAVGSLAADVNSAIYFEAEELAEQDVADMERNRAESRGENLIAMAEFDRAVA